MAAAPASAPAPSIRPHTFTPPACWAREAKLSPVDDLDGARSWVALAIWTTAIASVIPHRTRGAGTLALVTLLSRAHGHAHRRLRGQMSALFRERESVKTAIGLDRIRQEIARDDLAQDLTDRQDTLERQIAALDRTVHLHLIGTPEPGPNPDNCGGG